MSDFLTHLASRAVAPVPAVRPLVRSPYEPQAVDEFKLPEALPAPAILGFQPLPTVQPRVPLTPGRDSEIMDHRDALRSPQPVSSAPVRIQQTPPTIVAAPVHVAARLEPLGEGFPQPLAVKIVPEGQPSANLVPAPVIVTHIDAKAIAPAVTSPVEPVTPSPVVERIPLTPNITPAAVPRLEDRPQVAAPLPPLRPRVQTVQQIFPRPSPSRPVAAAAAQPAPQVTVTIGRVEIRAAAPAVQAPLPAANNRPPLSLDTYLRQRASRSA
jgi:hypothetical protein